jgi:dipeptidyl aminopeptidase/acylaminoacyl peptidase
MKRMMLRPLALVLSLGLVQPASGQPAAAANDLEQFVTAMANVGAVWSPTLSPDGNQLAFVSMLTGVPQIWIMPLEGGYPRQVTALADPILAVSWSPDGGTLAFSLAPGGGMNSQIYLIRPDGTGLCRITDGGKETNLLGPWVDGGRGLMISSSRRDPSMMDSLRYDLATSEMRLIAENPGLGLFLKISKDSRRGILWRMKERIDENLFLVDLATGKEVLLTPHDPPGRFSTGELSPDGSIVYLQTDKDRDKTAFGRVRIDKNGVPGPIEVVVERPDGDIQEFKISPDGRAAAIAWNVGGRSVLEFIDLRTGRITPGPQLLTELVGDLTYTPDGSKLLLGGFGSAAPPDFFLFDLKNGDFRQITFSGHAGVSLQQLVKPELVKYRSFDGLEISGWLYRPRNADYPAPLILVSHGGPEEQERPSFLGTYQALLQRGIAIFAPNFRGSSGFGKRFMNLDNRDLRFNVVKDIKAGVDHLVQQGIADPKRLGMFGFSYGGYLTLSTITEYPDLFAAAASLSGIVNFETFFAHTEPWMATISRAEYGDPQTEKELLARLSPIHRIERVITPTLVLHGANDTNVPVIEAEQVVKNLERRKVPVQYVLFPDEGHGVQKAANRVTYAMAILHWFEKYLVSPPQGGQSTASTTHKPLDEESTER